MNATIHQRFLFAAVTALGVCSVVLLGGCPGSLDDPSRFTGTGGGNANCNTATVEAQLTSRCSEQAGCHSAADLQGSLDLESANIAARVNGVPATSSCGPDLLADPNDPENSVLYVVLTGDSCSPFGRMPLNNTAYTADEIDCVAQWISGLTPGNTTSSGMGGSMGGAGGTAGVGGAGGAGGN